MPDADVALNVARVTVVDDMFNVSTVNLFDSVTYPNMFGDIIVVVWAHLGVFELENKSSLSCFLQKKLISIILLSWDRIHKT